MILKYIRLALCAVAIALSASLWIIICLFRPAHPGNTLGIARIIGLIGRYILGINVKIEGREILNNSKRCILVSNHQSNYDIFCVGPICPPRTVSMGKKSLAYIPFFGQMYWLAGNILIDRQNKKKAWAVMDSVISFIKKYDCNVWIMPEGTRSKGRGVLPFKKGAFLTAIRGQLDVVPIAISSFEKSVDLTKWQAGSVLFKVLSPIPTTGKNPDDAIILKDQVHDLIEKTVAELDLKNN